MKNLSLIYFLAFSFFLTSCGAFGIHFNVHNPKKPGKPPKFSEEAVLLGAMTPYRSCFDVHYYDLSVTLDPYKQKGLAGNVEIHAIAQTDFDTLQIDLHPDFEILRIFDKENEKAGPLNYEWKERAIFVHYPQKKGSHFILKVEYEGKPPFAKNPPWEGGFVWKKDKNGKPWVGVACESEGASVWWPLKDHTADEPDSIRLHYTVPKDLVAVGNGQFIGKYEGKDQTTWEWFVSYPINTYNVTIYVGDFQILEDTYTGVDGRELVINHYVLPENYQKAKKHFEQVKPIIRSFENWFGPYPWYRDGFKLIESPYAGMEHQTAIAYGNGYKNDIDSATDYIIVHETAHEWWGNSITARDLADVWIQEGFATYAESLFFEDRDGETGYFNHIWFTRLMIQNKYPVVGVRDRRWFHFKKGADAYGKGAWILHTLRWQIVDDDLFFDIIRTFYDTYKYKIVESQDFIDIVNAKTGKDYSWFFDYYLYQNFSPELQYTTSDDGFLYFKWTNTPDSFNQLKVYLETQAGISHIIPTNEVQKVELPKTEDGFWSFEFLDYALYALKEEKGLRKGE
ncbi:MAG: M1 family metallopeptidase [Bacteroidetes bacterium]|nr:M1 family metallopeptidase [Bacteroidota bacterium]MCB0845649.1 M1 family metallopeptidase [Bacteroidota bacterium]MCB0851193.1 M1 family metallopeptidase [Bacteroidota bacterium]